MKESCQTVSKGTQQEEATDWTPGIEWTDRTPSRTKSLASDVFSKRVPERDICMTSVLRDSKPGFTARSAIDVRISSAAPIRRTSASANSNVTRRARVLFCRKPDPDRLLVSLSVALKSAYDAWNAGIRPNTTPVPNARIIVKAITRQSGVTPDPFAP